jgi:hypothetical protein
MYIVKRYCGNDFFSLQLSKLDRVEWSFIASKIKAFEWKASQVDRALFFDTGGC